MHGRVGLFIAVALLSAALQAQVTAFKFDFGIRNASPGRTVVAPDMLYSRERGFGFEPGAPVRISDGAVASGEPFYFSVALPDGNYRVTVTFGDRDAASTTTVKAELRRLMLEKVTAAPGKYENRSFIVNVRTPQISTGGEVRLKGMRESVREAWNWDPRLTLEFSNTRPTVRSIEIEKVDVPTIYILGDSTSCDQAAEPYSSWGQSITRFFDDRVAVANHGESGESISAAIAARRTDKIYDLMKPGDCLLIQFGHNDMKSTRADALDRFKNDLAKTVEETRKRGGTPVLITPVSRRSFRGGTITNSLVTGSGADYLAAVHDVARETHAALIDLNAMSKVLYEAMGPEKAQMLFAAPGGRVDGTHHNDFGSYEIAKCVLEGIKQNHLGIAKYIVTDYAGFDPARPDTPDSFTLPPDPAQAFKEGMRRVIIVGADCPAITPRLLAQAL